MTSRHKKALKALAAFLVFAFAQVYVQAGLPGTVPGGAPQRIITARLTTKNNTPITVNGNTAGTGATILTGATIETPDQVSGTIDLGEAGVVEVEPNSKIQIDFDQNGNVRVKVLRGCAVARRKANVLPNASTEIYSDGASEKTDNNRRHMGFCLTPNGGLSPYGAVPGGGAGLSHGALTAILVGGGVGGGLAIYFATRGGNPSPAR
jgi:hypothetical protein